MDSANRPRGDLLLFHRAPGRPAEELALDEALLDLCEAGEGPGFLRFWEPAAYFVVLGYSKALELEADRAACDGLGIPILRRCSGGGTVLQGPGALNYTLVLPAGHAPELATITGANRWIMERNRSAVTAIGAREAQILGHTDLTLGGRKFSGNAQRRKQRSLLFHGSFLLDFDLDLIAEDLNRRKVIGRFSTFLEHVKPLADGERVTRFNALFHWAVPPGREIEAGCEVGRHHILTHAYWREGGPEFRNVNIMAVAHGTDKDLVLAHKAAIDQHLENCGIPVSYTNVFWGGRSEIKPSEISPFAYRAWCETAGIDPEQMRP